MATIEKALFQILNKIQFFSCSYAQLHLTIVCKTRMTTSISSKAFCSITDRQTNKKNIYRIDAHL